MEASFGSSTNSQRSKLYCRNNNAEESQWATGPLTGPNLHPYARSTSIANGVYLPGDKIVFELWVVRTSNNLSIDLCSFADQKVILNTWEIEVEFTLTYEESNRVGVNTSNPASSLDINGKIKLSNDNDEPLAGMLRFNSSTNDFEGFNGMEWLSLTKNGGRDNWGDQTIKANFTTDELGDRYNLGSSVAVHGDFAVVGGIENIAEGKVYFYKRIGDEWQSRTILNGNTTFSEFGGAVAMNEKWVVVGAFKENSPSGAVSVYSYSSAGFLSLVDNFNGGINYFGNSLDLDGDNLVIGADLHNLSDGGAFIYNYDSLTSNLTQVAYLTSIEAGDNFGSDVSIDGNYAAISARRGSNNFTNEGLVYIYRKIGSAWIPADTLTAPNPSAGLEFGNALSLYGNRLAVAAQLLNEVYLYRRDGVKWIYETTISSSKTSFGDRFGHSVKLNDDYLLIGAPNDEIDGKILTGSSYLFHKLEDGTWMELDRLESEDKNTSENFGQSVDMDNGVIIVGQPGYSNSITSFVGRACFFIRTKFFN